MRMFGREAKEDVDPINVRDMATSALNLIGKQLRLLVIDVMTEFSEDCASVLGHLIQLEQLILNFLCSARDAIAQRGRKAKITLRVFEDDEGVHIIFQNTGGGIPEDVPPHIFGPCVIVLVYSPRTVKLWCEA
jgi:C4-dicarboxylate-specific signal transduction histidine kinase